MGVKIARTLESEVNCTEIDGSVSPLICGSPSHLTNL